MRPQILQAIFYDNNIEWRLQNYETPFDIKYYEIS